LFLLHVLLLLLLLLHSTQGLLLQCPLLLREETVWQGQGLLV
jgi:hypothetical protein